MRRVTLYNSLRRIIDALRSSGLVDIYQAQRSQLSSREDRTSINGALYHASTKLLLEKEKFTKDDMIVIENLGIQEIFSPEYWSMYFFDDKKDESIFRTIGPVNFINHHVDNLITLIAPSREGEPIRIGSAARDKDIGEDAYVYFSVILPDLDTDSGLSPDRVASSVSAIEHLHDVLSVMFGASDSKLSIVSMDSGSEGSFDFAAQYKVVQKIVELLKVLYQRIMFLREIRASLEIENIANSLPVFEKIAELENKGSLPPEQAEIIRRKTLHAVTGFVRSGAILPEFRDIGSLDPALVVHEPARLLEHNPQANTSRSPKKRSTKKRAN